MSERCLLGFNSGPPMTPSVYNNNMQLFQTADHVVILNEMVHNARIIPLDGRAHLPDGLRQWVGDSRASWEGDTLVVTTTNFLRETSFGGSSASLNLVERITRIDADTLRYEFTVSDPTAWAAPWTARVDMTRTDEPLYEYACHEGNYSMASSLSGARALEAAEAARTRAADENRGQDGPENRLAARPPRRRRRPPAGGRGGVPGRRTGPRRVGAAAARRRAARHQRHVEQRRRRPHPAGAARRAGRPRPLPGGDPGAGAGAVGLAQGRDLAGARAEPRRRRLRQLLVRLVLEGAVRRRRAGAARRAGRRQGAGDDPRRRRASPGTASTCTTLTPRWRRATAASRAGPTAS